MNENNKNTMFAPKFRSFYTLHNLGMVIIALVALSVTWTSVKVIQRNFKLMKQISVLEQEVKLNEVSVKNQKLMNEYYKTDTYLEIAARKQFNKALPGEKLMLVPKSIALEKVASLKKNNNSDDSSESKLSNWQLWMRFLSGRAIGD